MDKDLLKKTEASKILEDINENHEIELMSEKIKDNKIDFVFNDNKYRVRLLNSKDKEDLYLFKTRKMTELLKDENILPEKELIKLYIKKGIDIDKLDKDIEHTLSLIRTNQMKLGELLSKKASKSSLSIYEDKIKNLKNELYLLTIQKSDLLEYSFERIFENSIIKMTAFLSLEKNIDDKYTIAFDSFDDFISYDEELVAKTIASSMIINYIK
jgi:hypothetical protein